MNWTTEVKGNAVTKQQLEQTEDIDFGKEQEEWNKQYAKKFLKKQENDTRTLVLGIWGDPKTG